MRNLEEGQHLEPNAHPAFEVTTRSHPYLLNHDRRHYVDNRAAPPIRARGTSHPLPWLTADGFALHPTSLTPYGTWARRRISVSPTAPHGWTQLFVDFR